MSDTSPPSAHQPLREGTGPPPVSNGAPVDGGPDRGRLIEDLRAESFEHKEEAEQARIIGEDFRAAFRLRDGGQLAPYASEHVAVLRGRIVGHGADPTALRAWVAREFQVHPERIVTVFVEGLDALVI